MEWKSAILKWKIKESFIAEISKGNIFMFLNFAFCLKDFRVNVSKFSINLSKIFLSLKGIAKFKLTLQLPSVHVLFFSKFLLCYKNNILPTSNWLIERFPLMTTKIPHDEWLALRTQKGRRWWYFLQPGPINIHLLSVRCPFIFILLYTAVTVNENNIHSRFYYADIQ